MFAVSYFSLGALNVRSDYYWKHPCVLSAATLECFSLDASMYALCISAAAVLAEFGPLQLLGTGVLCGNVHGACQPEGIRAGEDDRRVGVGVPV